MNHHFTPSKKGCTQLFLHYDGLAEGVSLNIEDCLSKKGTIKITKMHTESLETGSNMQATEQNQKALNSHHLKLSEKDLSTSEFSFQSLHRQQKQSTRQYNPTEIVTRDTEELVKRLERTVKLNTENIYQMKLDFQRTGEQLRANISYLQEKLSLTQQQFLSVQSLITSSRLWVVSHDQFVIGKEIGRGAWATVHEATFRGATVAAKCLHTLLITNPVATQLFQRVMEMAFTCQHQNIVTFLGSTLEGPPVILMELMDTSLRSAYELGIVKDNQIHGILHDVAKALHFLHTRPDPVIHRDVSSANVLLKVLYNSEWLAKLGDLGSAKIQQQVATGGPGAIVYSAPEAGDYTKQSPKMDVYSFGIVFIETLTKTHPFQMVDTLKAQVQQHYPQYDQLVTSCTKQQSSDRPKMHDVLTQLDGIGAAKQSLVADFV